jgi:hypothetical protein
MVTSTSPNPFLDGLVLSVALGLIAGCASTTGEISASPRTDVEHFKAGMIRGCDGVWRTGSLGVCRSYGE